MKKSGKWETIVFGAGLTAVMLSFLPYLVLGTDAVVPYHDQLDGEVLAYLFQAKYLFSGENLIPEFLGGAAKTALTPPAPLAVLLFCFLKPFAAYLGMQFLGQLVAYIGMYFLAGRVTDKPLIAAVCALLFAYLPFRPVYGLSQFGMPLLFLCICNLYQRRRVLLSMAGIALYAASSSFVLCGFGILLVWGVAICVLLFKKQLREKRFFLAGFGVLFLVYLLENAALFLQLMGIGAGYTSHKAEYALVSGPFFSSLWSNILHNCQYAEDYHVGILCISVLTLSLLLLWRKKLGEEGKKRRNRILFLLGGILALCLIGALWQTEPAVNLRSGMGSPGAFQLDRLLWMAPVFWYLLLCHVLDFWAHREERTEGGSAVRGNKAVRILAAICLCAVLGVTGLQALYGSLVKPNVAVLAGQKPAISWSDYYADGVMEQAADYILDTAGLKQEEYRVASLGIDPAAALYHGFYTVDGYSNNYALEYKHRFREVIAPELARSDYLTDYYDGWGNRCYLFSAEAPGYYTIQKGSFWYQELKIDTEKLAALSCRYILSAAYIVNSKELGLVLLTEKPFETDSSYYRIFLYEINP